MVTRQEATPPKINSPIEPITSFRLQFNCARQSAKSKGTRCHCRADTHARIGLCAKAVEIKTAKTNSPINQTSNRGSLKTLPLKCIETKTIETARDMHPETTKNFKSALIIRKGMKPRINSLGLIFKWNNGVKRKQTLKIPTIAQQEKGLMTFISASFPVVLLSSRDFFMKNFNQSCKSLQRLTRVN